MRHLLPVLLLTTLGCAGGDGDDSTSETDTSATTDSTADSGEDTQGGDDSDGADDSADTEDTDDSDVPFTGPASTGFFVWNSENSREESSDTCGYSESLGGRWSISSVNTANKTFVLDPELEAPPGSDAVPTTCTWKDDLTFTCATNNEEIYNFSPHAVGTFDLVEVRSGKFVEQVGIAFQQEHTFALAYSFELTLSYDITCDGAPADCETARQSVMGPSMFDAVPCARVSTGGMINRDDPSIP